MKIFGAKITVKFQEMNEWYLGSSPSGLDAPRP
jgi:hypothetical protein